MQLGSVECEDTSCYSLVLTTDGGGIFTQCHWWLKKSMLTPGKKISFTCASWSAGKELPMVTTAKTAIRVQIGLEKIIFGRYKLKDTCNGLIFFCFGLLNQSEPNYSSLDLVLRGCGYLDHLFWFAHKPGTCAGYNNKYSASA